MKSSIEVGQFHRSWKRYVEVGNIMLLNNLSKLRSAFSIKLKTETFSLHSLKFRLSSLKFPEFLIFPTTMGHSLCPTRYMPYIWLIDVKAVSHDLKWSESVLTLLTICLWIGFVNQQLALNLFSCQILYLSRLFIYITWSYFTWPLRHVIHSQFALSYPRF